MRDIVGSITYEILMILQLPPAKKAGGFKETFSII
jgi:hypothetical protein